MARHPVAPGSRGTGDRFPGFDVLGQSGHWDEVTAEVVLGRLHPTPAHSFFSATERVTATALLDRLLGQDVEPKVPVAALVERRLAAGETDGWRYDDLPEDGEAWRATLAALDRDARGRHGEPFALLEADRQEALVQAVQDGDTWHGWRAGHVWSLWTRYACTAFYAHPWAWNEIGFGGPAYPRGYKALGVGKREGWEVADRHPDRLPGT